MKLVIISGNRSPRRETLELPESSTVRDLRHHFRPSLAESRKSFRLSDDGAAVSGGGKSSRVSLDSLVNADKPLAELGVRDGCELVFKDLGPQIGYRTVFVVEYAGPMIIMALYALFSNRIFFSSVPSVALSIEESARTRGVQLLFVWLFILHFVKRELETFFVHKFSRPTMPLRNIFKNCSYYWCFAAVIGYFLCHPSYVAPSPSSFLSSPTAAAALMIIFEAGNLAVHVQLSSMRREEGDTSRNVPQGPLFSLVSCPNYTFEILAWVAFSLGTGLWASWAFTAVGLAQMTQWALKKHKDYVKADPANRRKKSIIPFVI